MPVEGRDADRRLARPLIRRLALKQRDADEPHLLLVVADTAHNRAAIAAAGVAVADAVPSDGRARALASLAAGRHPGGSALIFL